MQTHCTVVPTEEGLVGRACARGEAQSCRTATLQDLGLDRAALDTGDMRCALVQPIMDMRSNKVLALLCAVNKRAAVDAGQNALFSEPKFTVNDM